MRFLGPWLARAGTTLALLVIAAGMGLLAVAFLCAALYLGLVEPLGKPLAALVTGCVLAAIASLVMLLMFLLLRQRTPPKAPPRPDDRPAVGELAELLGEEAGKWARQHPGSTLLAALVAGIVVGSSPKIRARILNLFR